MRYAFHVQARRINCIAVHYCFLYLNFICSDSQQPDTQPLHMSQFTYNGPLLTRQEFADGKSGVYLVEGYPVRGFKWLSCRNDYPFGFTMKNCRVSVLVPVGEHIVVSEVNSGVPRISARASGIDIDATASIVKSAFNPEYEYWKTRTNRPLDGCEPGNFFNLNSQAECGMHFTFISNVEEEKSF